MQCMATPTNPGYNFYCWQIFLYSKSTKPHPFAYKALNIHIKFTDKQVKYYFASPDRDSRIGEEAVLQYTVTGLEKCSGCSAL